ncbi:STAS domain-containing protein [Kitasatospora sp. NPDC050463]|uniref:STAS domain-containing protein n=1 Tax=Kitasatospora sp. NPDC050463 TaxID=3155786 RepID=UPI0033D43FE4
MFEDPFTFGRPGPEAAVPGAAAGQRHRARRLLLDYLAVDFTAGSERPRAQLKGEIDMDVTDRLHDVLEQALVHSRTGLDIDMSGVEFCDSSGLNVLLRLRLTAQAGGRTLTITDASPQVKRLLAVTETAALFTAVPADPHTPHTPHDETHRP